MIPPKSLGCTSIGGNATVSGRFRRKICIKFLGARRTCFFNECVTGRPYWRQILGEEFDGIRPAIGIDREHPYVISDHSQICCHCWAVGEHLLKIDRINSGFDFDVFVPQSNAVASATLSFPSDLRKLEVDYPYKARKRRYVQLCSLLLTRFQSKVICRCDTKGNYSSSERCDCCHPSYRDRTCQNIAQARAISSDEEKHKKKDEGAGNERTPLEIQSRSVPAELTQFFHVGILFIELSEGNVTEAMGGRP